jgi:hypothetical protein
VVGDGWGDLLFGGDVVVGVFLDGFGLGVEGVVFLVLLDVICCDEVDQFGLGASMTGFDHFGFELSGGLYFDDLGGGVGLVGSGGREVGGEGVGVRDDGVAHAARQHFQGFGDVDDVVLRGDGAT